MADPRSARAALGVFLTTLVVGCDPPEREAGQWPIALGVLVAGNGAVLRPDPGEAPYRRTCVACHGADGKGNGQKTGADFTRPEGVLTHPDEELLRSIHDGKQGPIGVMPAHRLLLKEGEDRAVLAYVRTTFGAGIAPAPAVPAPSGAPAASAKPPG